MTFTDAQSESANEPLHLTPGGGAVGGPAPPLWSLGPPQVNGDVSCSHEPLEERAAEIELSR